MDMMSASLRDELEFLVQQTGKEESEILVQALNVGLNQMFLRTAEESYVGGELVRDQAIAILGVKRVSELDYAMSAIVQDIERGLRL